MYGRLRDDFVSLSAEPALMPDCSNEKPHLPQKTLSASCGTAEDSFLRLVDDLEKEFSTAKDRSQVASRYQAWIEQNSVASPALFAAWFNIGVELSQAGNKAGAVEAYRNALAI